MKPISNLKSGRLARGAVALLPVALSITALGGFTVIPTTNRDEARASHGAVRQFVAQGQQQRHRFQEYDEAKADDRVESALARVKSLVPRGSSELELHSLLRVIAEASRLSLESLAIGEPLDAGFEPLDELIAVRRIELRGSGPIRALTNVDSLLRAGGHPTAVREFRFSRADDREDTFRWHAVLGVFEATDLPEIVVPEGGANSGGEMP